jgi:hypothetical protein
MLAQPNFERRLDEVCEGLQPHVKNQNIDSFFEFFHLLGKCCYLMTIVDLPLLGASKLFC